MKTLIKTSVLLLAAMLVACTAETGGNEPDTVTVNGSAEREVMPDYYQLHLLLEERGEDGAALAAPLERRLETLLSIARDYGLEDDDIRAWEVQLRQESHWDREQQRQILGDMRLSRQVRLNADADIDMGAFLGEILASGAAQVQQIQSRLHDARATQGELLGEATANARQRAAAIAEGDGRTLGRLLRAEESGRMDRVMVTGSRMEQADTAISFEPEPIQLSVNVQTVFAMD